MQCSGIQLVHGRVFVVQWVKGDDKDEDGDDDEMKKQNKQNYRANFNFYGCKSTRTLRSAGASPHNQSLPFSCRANHSSRDGRKGL